MQRMFRRQKGFLAVKNRRIGACPVVVATGLAGDEIDDDCLLEGGMRVLFKIRIGEEGNLRGCRVEFQKIEVGADFQSSPEFRHRDAEDCWNRGAIAGIDEIHRAGEPFAVWKRVEGLAVFG